MNKDSASLANIHEFVGKSILHATDPKILKALTSLAINFSKIIQPVFHSNVDCITVDLITLERRKTQLDESAQCQKIPDEYDI